MGRKQTLAASVVVIRRREEDEFHPIWPVDIAVVPRGNIEKITACDPRLRTGVHHSHHEIPAYAVAGVVHRA